MAQWNVQSDIAERFDAVRLSRRQLLRRSAALGLAIPAVASLLAACADDDDDVPAVEPEPDDDEDDGTVDDTDDDVAVEDDDEDEDADEDEPDTPDDERYGGTLNVALIGEPPTFDLHQTTATVVAFNTWHMYEPLFTWDEDLALMPELAEEWEVSDDGLAITVHLLEGVNFHNGEVMTSADVIDSIERWGSISGLGAGLLDAVETITEVDDHTIEFAMNRQLGAFTTILARQNQGCAIYPKSVIDASGTDNLTEYVGTGPFRFVEHRPDRHIHYERFDDYTDRPWPASGYGGSKARYLDEIFFIPVPEEAARIAGLQAGDYHYLEDIIPDHYETLKDDPSVSVELLAPTTWGTFVMNMAEGICANQTLRQAIQTALEHEEMGLAAYGEDFFRLDPGVMFEETAWHSLVGEDRYSPADPDRARELAEEAGYDGEPIRLMTTQEYAYMYNNAVVAEQQLEDAGFNIEVDVVDWATLVDQRNDPAAWDMFTTGITFRIDPIQLPFMQGTTWPGWWGTDDKVELTQQLQSESDFDTRFGIWEDIQDLFYDEVPLIKVADELELNAKSPLVQNFTPLVQLSAVFYNVWLEDS
jgi:peptide/nickel transport system substrate-binding protein